MNLASGNLDDDGLNWVLSSTPSHSIILLEDIDSIFIQRESVKQATVDAESDEEDDGPRRQEISFSGLINALDGVRS